MHFLFFFICYQERKFSNTNWCIYHHLRCVLSPQVLVTNPKIKDCWWRNFESNFIHLRPRRCILWYFATVAACLDWLQLSCKRCLSQPATARQAGEPVPLQNKTVVKQRSGGRGRLATQTPAPSVRQTSWSHNYIPATNSLHFYQIFQIFYQTYFLINIKPRKPLRIFFILVIWKAWI